MASSLVMRERIAAIQLALCTEFVSGGERSFYATGEDNLAKAVASVAEEASIDNRGCVIVGGNGHYLRDLCIHAANIPGQTAELFCLPMLLSDFGKVGASIGEALNILAMVGVMQPGDTKREECASCVYGPWIDQKSIREAYRKWAFPEE